MKKLFAYIILSFFIALSAPALIANQMVATHVDGVEDNVLPFTVYPNPLSTGKLVVNLGFEQSNADVSFSIINVLGQPVYTYAVTAKDYTNGSFSVDLSNISVDKGIYFMKMSLGDKSSVQKLVIK